MNAIGIDASANGQKSRQWKCPARQNWIDVIVATRMFRASEVGFITSCETPISAIAARYPDAPACPTDEYKNATSRMQTASSATVLSGIAAKVTPAGTFAPLHSPSANRAAAYTARRPREAIP